MIDVASPSDYRIVAEQDGLIQATYKDWVVLCTADRRRYLDWIARLIAQKNLHPLKEFKKSYRDQVALIEPMNERVIYKVSRRERFILQKHLMTFFKDSEAFATLKSARRLQQKGMKEIYHPFMALEKRRWNMVQETILLYDYVEGQDCIEYGEKSFPWVIEALKKCHAMGCRHSDAKPRNFIVQNDRVLMIDSRFKRNVMGRFGEYCDFITLVDNLPEVGKYIKFNKRNLPYLAAKTYRVIKQNNNVRRFKQALRAKRSRRFELEQSHSL
ncbi:MAG TPA: hypothetical protein DCZ95_03910 [Verrucomicrobia bacterium]|nr:hypothetical protein [Verrucomicrobiota bacterium]